MSKRNLTFPMYLSWEHGIIEVVGEINMDISAVFDDPNWTPSEISGDGPSDDTTTNGINYGPDELEDGKGYVIGNIVYVYSKEKPNVKTSSVPLFWFTKFVDKNNYTLKTHVPMPVEEICKKFSIDHMVDVSYTRILNETTGDEVLYNEQMINDMNVARSKFTPIVNTGDDYLKRLVKYIIIKKDVDINRYKSVMDTPYALTNMKSALCATTKMSVTNFLMWVELLQVDFSILVTDNGVDKVNPLREGLLYRSTDNSVYQFANEKAKALLVDSGRKDLIDELKNFENEILEKLPDHTTSEDFDDSDDDE